MALRKCFAVFVIHLDYTLVPFVVNKFEGMSIAMHLFIAVSGRSFRRIFTPVLALLVFMIPTACSVFGLSLIHI